MYDQKFTVEMLDDFLDEQERKFVFATGKQGRIDFERAMVVTVLSKKELDAYTKRLENELEEGIYWYDGMSFEYQGRVK